jgi:hypothetical protein
MRNRDPDPVEVDEITCSVVYHFPLVAQVVESQPVEAR